MMRVVQVTGSAEWAGGERHLLDLLARLDRSTCEVRVVCPAPGPLVERLERMGVPVRVVSLQSLGSRRALARLVEALREWRPSLVQSHGARSNFYSRLAARRLNLAHVATVHNALADYPIPAWKKWIYQRIDGSLARHSKVIVCVSESLRQDLMHREGLPPGQVRVIHNGVDTDRFNPGRVDRTRLKQQLGLPGACWLVGVVGRMTRQKGHTYFLKAFTRLRQTIREARAVFVGDGPLRPVLERQVKTLGLHDLVTFAGVREDMPEVLAGLDLLVLSSVSEGLPYVVLEALAMETPVVATSVNGVPEILTDEIGLMVPPRDPQALAEAMEHAHADAERTRAIAQRGRHRIQTQFSLETMCKRWETLYQEVVGRDS